jgi:heme-degrading monooxygenase HmoA
MIFEFSFDVANPSNYEEYLTESTQLRELLPFVDGFEGIKRFESVNEPGSFVAIGFFRDEAAVANWRNTPEHRRVQALGRDRLFTDYRLRMAEVVRDYGPLERADAPLDSRAFHKGSTGPDRRLHHG